MMSKNEKKLSDSAVTDINLLILNLTFFMFKLKSIIFIYLSNSNFIFQLNFNK